MHGDAPTRNEVATKTATSAAAEYHRSWRHTETGRAKFVAAIRRYRERNPDKNRAHRAVDNALRAGKLTKGACEIGQDCNGRIEAHHDDYTQPLNVRWVCKRHHRQLDRERSAREVA